MYDHIATPISNGPDGFISPASVTQQLSPSQIRKAYGIDSIMSGSIVGDGTGQTIAIVNAYQNTHITTDLSTFDSHFGLAAPPSFTVLNENGGTDLSGVPADSGWAMEIALDVEWAHAVAPGAKIVLFEANSSGGDLYTAVSTAAAYNNTSTNTNVSVVSMSWSSGEYGYETILDGYFKTPSGHNGVTFLASTGDDGSPGGYPAYSPNVVAVGGTTLNIKDSTGTYNSEAGWSGSGGGTSQYESRPTYQNSVPGIGSMRETPDVSFDADPASGVLVYDAGWYNVGGTSLSAACWAGLIAITNQLHVANGQSVFNTSSNQTQTQTYLYALAANDYHDVTSGSNGGFSCGTGYDEVTGIGTPLANKVAVGDNTSQTPDTPGTSSPRTTQARAIATTSPIGTTPIPATSSSSASPAPSAGRS